MKLQKAFVLVRDSLSLVVGATVILHQEITGTEHLDLLLGALALLGVPGAAAALAVGRGKVEPTDTTGPSSESQDSQSLPL